MKILYETKREAMYRNVKYWGKKPHNIWNELISDNTTKGDIVFDPFLGSNVSFFESLVLGRIPVGIDINPLSSFVVEVYSHDYSSEKILEHYERINEIIIRDQFYNEYYGNAKCIFCGHRNTVSNYIWSNDKIKECRFRCSSCNEDNVQLNDNWTHINCPYPNWVPYFDMRNLSLVSENTIQGFGGHNISDIYTNGNLYINILIFEEILKIEEPYRALFILVFIQMVHLTTKMCAVRGSKSNRLYSTSWGRPAYMALDTHMEQNPLIQFNRSIYGNSGVVNALESAGARLPQFDFKNLKSNELSEKFVLDKIHMPTIFNCDSKKNILKNESVDFIITDPPYGSIIQYGELSMVWNSWLRIAYEGSESNLKDEIIVNSNSDYSNYYKNLEIVFNNCFRYLKKDKKMIFTFNSNKKEDWNILENILKNIDFLIEDVYLQKNLRASEANVSSKQGMAISDFYIVLKKDSTMDHILVKENNDKKIEELWRIKDGEIR